MEEQIIERKVDYESLKDAYIIKDAIKEEFECHIDVIFEFCKASGLTDSSHISDIKIEFLDGGMNPMITIQHSIVRGINYWEKSRMQIKNAIVEFIENEIAEKSEGDKESEVIDSITILRNKIDVAIKNGNNYAANEYLDLFERYRSIVLDTYK